MSSISNPLRRSSTVFLRSLAHHPPLHHVLPASSRLPFPPIPSVSRLLAPAPASSPFSSLTPHILCFRSLPYAHVRFYASASVPNAPNHAVDGADSSVTDGLQNPAGDSQQKSNEIVVTSYWGIPSKPIFREDGTVWPWRCFMPWDTYKSNTSIDLKKHHVPETLTDKIAFWTVKALRWPTDIFFQLAAQKVSSN